MDQRDLDREYRVAMLRTLAYLFSHPEIESGIRWHPAQGMGETLTFGVEVNMRVFWATTATIARRRKVN